MRALKRFGQNFLTDKNIIRKIIREIQPQPGEYILEIGPGKGALTEELLHTGAKVVAIEIDRELCAYLHSKYDSYPNFKLIEGDALDLNWLALCNGWPRMKVVGNIPYNITSPLLFRVFELNTHLATAVFMVQKEIALRLCAQPNTKEYGILTVLAAFYGSVKIAFHIPPTVFRPQPKVWSSLIIFRPAQNNYSDDFKANFRKVVKTAFNQRRKTLKNALSTLLPSEITACPVNLTLRAENLSCDEFVLLTDFLNRK